MNWDQIAQLAALTLSSIGVVTSLPPFIRLHVRDQFHLRAHHGNGGFLPSSNPAMAFT